MTEQTKDQLYNEVLMYQGKILKKEGEGKKGPWKLWKLSFKKGDTYPWVVSCFDSLTPKSVQLEELKEGEYYEIVYKYNEFQGQYGTIKSKQCILIKPGTQEANTESKPSPMSKKGTTTTSPSTTPITQINPNTPIIDWDKFKPGYDKLVKEAGVEPNLQHMVGTYICNLQPHRNEELIKLAKEHMEQTKLKVD